MPINESQHWYFAVFQGHNLVIHDSLKKSQTDYARKKIIEDALKFGELHYGRKFQITIQNDYPQQSNNYDCGVFMVLGVRDKLRSKEWSYRQGDIRFKRLQMADEILKQRILFNDWFDLGIYFHRVLSKMRFLFVSALSAIEVKPFSEFYFWAAFEREKYFELVLGSILLIDRKKEHCCR